jgi:hypothetical protein
VIHCANAGFVLEKTLANRLADAFSKHLPAWQAKHNTVFSSKDSRAKRSRAIRSADERCILQSLASSLVEGFENATPA